MDLWDNFLESVVRHFHFLVTDLDYVSKPPKQPFVTYESEEVQVLVYFDADGRHELDLRIRRLKDDVRRIPGVGPGEMMMLTDAQAAEQYRSPFPSNEIDLELEVRRLAELLRRFGSSFLNGDDAAFELIERMRRDFSR
jgi:hypothetical protein